MPDSNKKNGKLLEKVIEKLCKGIKDAEVLHNVKVIGINTKRERQVDILIKGRLGPFNFKIEIEAKDHSKPVEISTVEAFATKIKDTGSNIGAMVCPTGFQAGAKAVAQANNIQLFSIEEEELNNTSGLIPLRMIIPNIDRWSVKFIETSKSPFYIPADLSSVRIMKEGKNLNLKQLLVHAWNTGAIPQQPGMHKVNFEAVKMTDISNPSTTQYCELSFDIEVKGKYYLKIVPANFLHDIKEDSKHFYLNIPIGLNEIELKKHWMEFESMDELNQAAEIENQPKDVQDLLIVPNYTMDINQINRI